MGRAYDILMIEDNPADVKLAREALKDAMLNVSMHSVPDGDKAMAFLRREGEYKDAPQPELILLDLNLPGKDGRQVLKEIKEDSRLKHMPVVVLTTSQAEEDICNAYKLQAGCYIAKPVDFDEFTNVIRAIENFWFNIIKLPPRECGQ
ncbi:MAG: response regulator [Nitrospiraceae bacterium]|nr:response regulator [Nitrospiraceae bacterium]